MSVGRSGQASAFVAVAIVVALLLVTLSLEATTTKTVDQSTTNTSTTTTTEILTTNPSENGFDCVGAGVVGSIPPPGTLPLVTGNNLYQCERVLVLPPGATGTLTVSYESDPSVLCPESEGCTPIANLTADILAPNWSEIPTIPEQYNYVEATGVTITADPATVNVSAVGSANISVIYTVTASSGVSGSYELQYFDACPTMIPLAVGTTAAQLSDSSFPDYQPFLQGCTQFSLLQGGWLVSISGFQSAWMVQSIQPAATAPERSGPISTFPASWDDICNSTASGNITTSESLGFNLSSIFDHINLNQVYGQIINSPAFVNLTAGRGWVVAEWYDGVGDTSANSGQGVDLVTGFFILIGDNGTEDGYVTANYNLQNGNVTTLFQLVLVTSCPASV